MESLDLSEAQVESIKKLSTARLISKLTTVGYIDEELDQMDRNVMLQTWAAIVAEGKDKPVAAAATVTTVSPSVAYDADLERY